MEARTFSDKGSQIQIIVETQGMMFSGDNLITALKTREFQILQGNINNPIDPSTPTVMAQIYSKGPLTIFMPPPRGLTNYLIFLVMNTIDLEKTKIGDKKLNGLIEEILNDLSLTEETISSITFTFTTRFAPKNLPIERLTALINRDFIKKLKKIPALKSSNALSLRFGDKFPIDKEGVNIVFEPLVTDPDKLFYLQFIQKFRSKQKFQVLLSDFPKILFDLMNGVDPLG